MGDCLQKSGNSADVSCGALSDTISLGKHSLAKTSKSINRECRSDIGHFENFDPTIISTTFGFQTARRNRYEFWPNVISMWPPFLAGLTTIHVVHSFILKSRPIKMQSCRWLHGRDFPVSIVSHNLITQIFWNPSKIKFHLQTKFNRVFRKTFSSHH